MTGGVDSNQKLKVRINSEIRLNNQPGNQIGSGVAPGATSATPTNAASTAALLSAGMVKKKKLRAVVVPGNKRVVNGPNMEDLMGSKMTQQQI